MKTKRRMKGKKQLLELFEGSRFLFRACQKVAELGVVGEKRNTLAILLACISRTLVEPVSVMGKGATASGKTKQSESCTQLFPPSCVIMRAGLSGKALAYGKGSLAAKILFINEYQGGRDAQQLLRLLQSDREIRHEATTIKGSRRRTDTAVRSGTPVVLTTTTEEVVYADDESRFLSLYANEGAAQTRAILVAKASAPVSPRRSDLSMWRKAMSMLRPKPGDFRNPPDWLRFVAELDGTQPFQWKNSEKLSFLLWAEPHTKLSGSSQVLLVRPFGMSVNNFPRLGHLLAGFVVHELQRLTSQFSSHHRSAEPQDLTNPNFKYKGNSI